MPPQRRSLACSSIICHRVSLFQSQCTGTHKCWWVGVSVCMGESLSHPFLDDRSLEGTAHTQTYSRQTKVVSLVNRWRWLMRDDYLGLSVITVDCMPMTLVIMRCLSCNNQILSYDSILQSTNPHNQLVPTSAIY